ncbi:MarC family protein [Chelatococcus sp. XZ-Ab1]|uniref:MarC family protein n=1 Tax=Chelatococcus sp. XZ-Ab1 TaxID=3034027 RepID=UPI0023E42E13|nr:MarC family protein [Chelatococcus sp. XZ-Ab1]
MLIDQTLLVTQFMTLLAVLDPISHTSLFLSVTGGLDRAERRKAALIAVPVAFVILLVFAVIGQYALAAMNISLISFQIAGGIILLIFALSMTLGDKGPAPAAEAGARDAASVAVYPLAVPIIAGPGAMLAIVILMDNNRLTFVEQVETVAMLALNMLILLGLFLSGGTVSRLIGRHGANVLRRVMGIVLAALSINLILEAMAKWLGLPAI